MKVKEIFLKAQNENGALTFEEFQKLAEELQAKFVDLSEGNYVSQSKYDDAMSKNQNELALRDTRIKDLGDTISQRDSDLENLKVQLASAGQDADKLAQLTNEFTNLQNKYDLDVKAYQEKLDNQAYEYAVRDFARGKDFTSKAAERDFVNTMLAKKLQMENGKILGADDFINVYQTENSDAFKQPEPEVVEVVEQPKPKFVDTTPGTGESDNTPGFMFNFTGVRPHGK